MPAFAAAIFTGAFLLFQVQPLIGKYILPWFGGGPGVWTTCMLFFQLLLLAGYAYAHLTSRWLRIRAQIVLHLILVGAALAFVPVVPGEAWKPKGGGAPVIEILLLLAANLGVPYFVLSSTGPLLQHWFGRSRPGVSPYRLYALSNAGSLLALVTYPFVVENHFSRATQATIWGWGLVIYAVSCVACAAKAWRSVSTAATASVAAGKQRVGVARAVRWLWVLLAACPSVLLLATTNKLCIDLAVVPFLWVIPLAVYLASFILCFDHPRWYQRFPYTLALIVAVCGVCWVIRGTGWSLGMLVAVYCGALFVCCMICHGELYRLRPEPHALTEFYLLIAAGGAVGSVFVAVLAPFLFRGYYELQIGLALCVVLFIATCLRVKMPEDGRQWRWLAGVLPIAAFIGLDRLLKFQTMDVEGSEKDWLQAARVGVWIVAAVAVALAILCRSRGKTLANRWSWPIKVLAPWAERKNPNDWQFNHKLVCVWLSIGVIVLVTALWFGREKFGDRMLYASRDFYGVMQVFDHAQGNPPEHILWVRHGQTLHGAQFAVGEKALWPTVYYGEQSGAGLVLGVLSRTRRIGIVGLGTGTMAAYGRSGDYLHFYEINPEVQRLAASHFTFLSNCAARVEVSLGDARLSLERQPSQQFDVLALDAFTSDAIPVHLLTVEAFELYERHLRTNGVVAVHISNQWLDLESVVANIARRCNYEFVVIEHDPGPDQWWLRRSVWALLTRNRELAELLRTVGRPTANRSGTVWTDDFSSLFEVMRKPE